MMKNIWIFFRIFKDLIFQDYNVHFEHLHMHMIYPKSDMGMLSKYITFKPGKVFKETTELTASIRDKAGLPPDPFEAKLEASGRANILIL